MLYIPYKVIINIRLIWVQSSSVAHPRNVNKRWNVNKTEIWPWVSWHLSSGVHETMETNVLKRIKNWFKLKEDLSNEYKMTKCCKVLQKYVIIF